MINKLIEYAEKFLNTTKTIPIWLLAGIFIASSVLYFSPLSLYFPQDIRPWLILTIVITITFIFTKSIDIGLQHYSTKRTQAKLNKTFHLAPIPHQCYWTSTKQNNGSIVTQLIADFRVKNCTNSPISLTEVKINNFIKSREVIDTFINIDYREIRVFSTQPTSGRGIPIGHAFPLRIMILFTGSPPKNSGPFKIRLSVFDDAGNQQNLKVTFNNIPVLKETVEKTFLEVPSSINDPIEKNIVSILLLELDHYKKCGRSVGGLGSIYTVISGQELKGVGNDSWQADSPKNQSLNTNPEAVFLKSENLDALIKLYDRLTSDVDKKRFVDCLLERIDEQKGYLSVAYFIVCVLWKLGYLPEALSKVKAALPQGEAREFGFSNVLMLLNGLLRNHHPTFPIELLDDVEQFILGLQEHTFRIAEKINAIRKSRLLSS